MRRRQIGVVLIQETSVPYTYEEENTRCTWHFRGITDGSNTARGVVTVYRNELRNCVDSILPVNERIIMVKIRAIRDILLINNSSHPADSYDLRENLAL